MNCPQCKSTRIKDGGWYIECGDCPYIKVITQ